MQTAPPTLDEWTRARTAKGQRRVLELLARGAPLRETLTALCDSLEEQTPNALCSVLLLDHDAATLRHGAAPRLPKAYCDAIDGGSIGPNAGSCGTAAFERREVIVEDIALDPRWSLYREVALASALRACASVPIIDAQDKVLGTFALYHREAGPFDVGELVLLRDASAIATLIIQSEHRDAAFRENQGKLSMAVSASGIGLWSWDPKTDKVVWEDPLCAIFGLPPRQAPVGWKGYLALIHPDDRERAGEVIWRGVASGAWEDEYRIIRADGTVRWVLVKGTVLRAEAGDVVLGAVTDVTERRQRDEEGRQVQKLEAVGQLTAGIAHNFNNMLMGILPNLALALRRASPDIVPLLRDAEYAAQRAAELVRQLTAYAGRNRPAAYRVEPLEALVERTIGICRTTFDRGILCETRYDPSARARVDAAQIEQALLNVLINARDALADSRVGAPRVTVEVDVIAAAARELAERPGSAGGDHVRIRVQDNGIGMDATTAARIFEPFFTTKPPGRGTGLGLATTHAIVREHGGWIACESTPGSGSTFSIYLPSATVPSSLQGARSEPAPTGGTETILIVDDEPSIRHVTALILESAGYKTKSAASGQAAIELLADAPDVALVLLDISMPGIPAAELHRRLRSVAPRVRLVLFTGYAHEVVAMNETVLEKPATEARLLRTVREVLDRTEKGSARGGA